MLGPVAQAITFRAFGAEYSLLEVELELAAHGHAEAVEKLAESWAGDVILHVTGVEVVSGVEYGQAHSHSSSSNPGDELW